MFKTVIKNPVQHIEWFVAATLLLFGLLFLVIIPPMQGADESNHFLRAYQIASGNMLSDYVGPSKGGISTQLKSYDRSVGGTLPRGVVDFTQAAFGDIPQHIDHKMSWPIFKKLAHYTNGTDTKAASFGNTAAYSPVAYAPQVVGIWIGKIISDRPIVAFYIARFVGLLVGAALIAWAVRLMPFGKLFFAVIALLPMVAAQLPIVTADTMAIGFAFLVTAATLRFAFRDADMSRREIVFLLAIFMVLGLVKPSLAPLAFVLLALLRNTFIAKRKAVAIIVTCIVATCALAAGWNMLVKDIVTFGYQQAYPMSNIAAQMSYIIHQPLAYGQVLLGTLFGHYFDFAVFSFIGIIGWADTALPMIAIVAGFVNVAFAFYLTTQSEKLRSTHWLKWLAVAIVATVFCVTATFMYLFCNNVKDTYVTGLQGRYLIPVVPVLAIVALFGKQTLKQQRFATLGKRCLYSSIVLIIVMAWVAVLRFYVPNS